MTTTSAVNPFATVASTSGSTPASTNEAGSSDRFLKLLVAQMQNQDPLNPMDNAQVTSQMAQISTVNGIESLNRTVAGLNTQFVQMQVLQGTSLVGREVTVAGRSMSFDASGQVGVGGVELAGPADRVKVEILDASGRVADTLQLGALGTGRHSFEWDASKAAPGSYTFRVTANSGTLPVTASPLMRDRVEAVSAGGDTLTLELARSGNVAYTAVKAFN